MLRFALFAALALTTFTGCASAEKTLLSIGHVQVDGDHIVTDSHINFASDKDIILEDSNELLDDLATLLKDNPDAIQAVKVLGHTDASGDDQHNKELSQRRAEAVKAALAARGVKQPVEAVGLGEAEPLCTEDTPECHERNRRVEFIIVNS